MRSSQVAKFFLTPEEIDQAIAKWLNEQGMIAEHWKMGITKDSNGKPFTESTVTYVMEEEEGVQR